MGLLPQSIGYASLGVAIAAYEQWLHAGGELTARLDDAMRELAGAFSQGAD